MGSSPAAPSTLHTHTRIMAQLVLFAALLALASGRPQYPVAAPVPVEAYPDLPPVYNYQYGVNDQGYSNSVFSQSEQRDGANAGGEYRVNLPDGRVQIVTYTAGPEGYNAAVTYEGEAQYPPEPAPGYKAAPLVKIAAAPVVIAPAPVVKVAPVVAPAPVVKVAAPIAPAYAPAPVVHHAPLVHHAPVVHHAAPLVHHAPVVHTPTYATAGYRASPVNPAYSPKKYGYTVVAKEEEPAAPAEEEARAAKAVEIEEAVFEEHAPAKAPEPVEAAEAPVEEVVEKVEEPVEVQEAEIASPDSRRYRYRFF